MRNPTQCNIAELLDAYHSYLLSKVSKVRILGEAGERELRDVFVELSIVDQRAPQQHAKFLGMMDSTIRRRFNPFANVDRDTSPELLDQRDKEIKRRVKPDELLRRRTKAIVTGPPGCGKTTLLKYLALQAEGKENRLTIWLELKAIDKSQFGEAEKVAAREGNLLLQELWLRHLKIQLSLSDAEIKLLRDHWQNKFKANEIAVLLDGFDELQDETIEHSLNKCVREFASASHDNTLLISTRPYAQHRLGSERLQELEIEPLNQRQIESFLNCYYPNEAAAKSLLENLREQSSLRELLHVPLLLGVILRLYRENRFTDERLKLYEELISDLVHELDRSKSVIRHFNIHDERIRLDFLKFIAFERLLRDPLDEEEQEASRIVFSYELLKEKARTFLAKERLSHNPRDLVDDTLAAPLLREVGANMFAFTHLTLQEYLAARSFADFYKNNELEGLKIFCRAYHNPTLVEMEVLPMILGATVNADKLYAEIQRWPESLTFANIRLRARGLTYSATVKQDRLCALISRLYEFISENNSDEIPYREIVVNSFVGISRQIIPLVEANALPLKTETLDYIRTATAVGRIGSLKAVDFLISALRDEDTYVRWNAVDALGRIGSEKAVNALISALNDKDSDVRSKATDALARIDSDKAIDALICASTDDDSDVRAGAIDALAGIGSDKALDVFIAALHDEDNDVRSSAVDAIGGIISDKAADALIPALKDNDAYVRWSAVDALGEIGSDKAVEAIISAFNDDNNYVRWSVAAALAETGSEKAINALISALNGKDIDMQETAAAALVTIGSEEAVDALVSALSSKNCDIKEKAAQALGRVGSRKAAEALISALNDDDSHVQESVLAALVTIGSEEAVDALVSALRGKDLGLRTRAAFALRQVSSDKAVDALISAMHDEDSYVRWSVVTALGRIGSDKAADALISALDDEDALVKERAADALRQIDSDKAVYVLISGLNDKDSVVRLNAASSLGATDSDRAVDALISALNDEDSSVRESAAGALVRIGSEKAVEALISALVDGDDRDIQEAAAAALASIGSDKAIDALMSSLNDENNEVQESVAAALVKVGSEKAVEALLSALNSKDGGLRSRAAEALAQMRFDSLSSVLTRTIKHHDTFTRKKAVSVIGYYSNDKQTLNQLKELALVDEDYHVRGAAKDATGKLKRKLELLGHFTDEGTAKPLSDNESRELFLIGEAFRIVAEAGHIFRPTPNSDWGIDGEIEFKNDKGKASGRRVYLQLKSGDSYLRKRKRDGKEIFTIKARHAEYWQSHAYPVLLVIRESGGQIRWMNVTEYLQRNGRNITQIEFQAEPFTAESVRQMCARFAH